MSGESTERGPARSAWSLGLLIIMLLLAAAWPSRVLADTVVSDGYLTVSDGTRLRYHLERPAGDGRFPVLLQYDGYSAGTGPDFGSLPALKERLLPKGYAFLGVSIRGTGCSGGRFDLFEPREARDGAEIVDWASRQPWSTGNVGMLGYSFPGVMQMFTAGQRPPALKAIAPTSIIADLYRDVAYPGGVPNSYFSTLFTAQQRYPSLTAVPSAVLAEDPECAANFAASQATSPVIAQQSADNPYIDDPLDYPARSPLTTAAQITVPVLLAAYWQDEQVGPRIGGGYQPGGLLTRLDPKRTWVTFANANHDYTPNNQVQLGLLERFFEHYLGGDDNGWESTPHIRILHDVRLSTSASDWITTYQTRPTAKPVALYLRSGRALATTGPRTPETPDGYDYPLPSASTNPQPGLTSDINGVWAAAGPDNGQVSYTTPPLARDLVTFGPASADLWLASTAPNTDLQATITEVRPDGSEIYVQRGWLRASARRLDPTLSTVTQPVITGRRADAAPLVPGVPTLLRLEVMPFGHTFRKGSSLRLIIDAPTGDTGDWGFNFIPTPARNTILHDPAHPSRLVLGTLPAESAGAPAAPCDDLINMPCRHATGLPVPDGALDLSLAPEVTAP